MSNFFWTTRRPGSKFRKMNRPQSSRFLPGFFVLALLAAASFAPADSAYSKWVQPWLERPAYSPAFLGGDLKLIVSRIKGEAEIAAVTNMTPVERLQLAYRIQVSAAEVATDGSLRTYFVSNTESTASPVRQMAATDFQQLDALLNQLPADRATLPPAGDRVVVQYLNAGQWRIRVYPAKNLPPEVKNLMSVLARPAKNLL
jgi:hypothetical protein